MTSAGRDALIPAGENRRMFDAIAPRYDFLNALLSLGLHRRWRRQAVAALLAGGGSRFLDLGCGTGDVMRELLRQAPSARVTGLDLSTAMLARAAVKLHGANNAAILAGNATRLPFHAAAFDGAIYAFTFRNLVDRAAALDELRHVLGPGRPVAILELTRPAAGMMASVHHLYTRRLMPLVGRIFSRGSAYRYLADSIDNFPSPPQIVAAMTRAGFDAATARPLTGGVVTLFTGRTPR